MALIFVLEVVLTFLKYWGKEYAFSVSDHFWFILLDQIAKVVRCKHKCKSRLSKIDLRAQADIVASIYHHLQYSYSKRE